MTKPLSKYVGCGFKGEALINLHWCVSYGLAALATFVCSSIWAYKRLSRDAFNRYISNSDSSIMAGQAK